jgi:DNA processing protein
LVYHSAGRITYKTTSCQEKFVQNSKLQNLSKDGLKMVQLLENEGLSFDEVIRYSKLNSSAISSLLSIMEIKGIIKNSGGLFQLGS